MLSLDTPPVQNLQDKQFSQFNLQIFPHLDNIYQTKKLMKTTIFQGITPCSLVEVHSCFGRIYCLQFQG
jgi:hypothetical protein